ncbi:MAG: aminoglycoside phosphotransferase family protein, partial [Candidatus Margulisbacteria bacterium]|nr:aminoglycoside phosphotransferase family protein [Candidatus Margulisiibacteriota bacterium]
MNHLIAVAQHFNFNGKILDISEYGSGIVNETFLITLDSSPKKFILQRINTHVFQHPEFIMHNLRIVTNHILERCRSENTLSNQKWAVPRIVTTKNNEDYFVDDHGGFWRAISFINHAQTYDKIEDIPQAYQAGYALGKFHSLICDIDINQLHDTLEGFHITPHYLIQYDEVSQGHLVNKKSASITFCHNFVTERRKLAHVLENAKKKNDLSLRTIHGDPKISNILFDEKTGKAISIIDLDTVKPGLVHYDIGDCLRSCCNPAGESVENLNDVYFDTDLCKAILDGYFSEAKHFLTEHDYDYIYDAIRLIAFELGLRFFTDYLEGNVYFKVKNKEHNLARALAQFKLVESIELEEQNIRTILSDLR